MFTIHIYTSNFVCGNQFLHLKVQLMKILDMEMLAPSDWVDIHTM